MRTHPPAPAASPLTLAPVSPAAAQLLHTVYAEALAQAEASIPRPPEGSIVLASAQTPYSSTYAESHGSRWLRIYSEGVDHHLHTDIVRPDWAEQYGEWHRVPGLWYGEESRRDAQGRQWQRRCGPFVDDGFGTLIEVPQ